MRVWDMMNATAVLYMELYVLCFFDCVLGCLCGYGCSLLCYLSILWSVLFSPFFLFPPCSTSFYLPFFLSSCLGPLLHQLSPAFLSKISPSLSFYSLLLCCIPVPVVKGVDKEEGGKKRKGELEL